MNSSRKKWPKDEIWARRIEYQRGDISWLWPPILYQVIVHTTSLVVKIKKKMVNAWT